MPSVRRRPDRVSLSLSLSSAPVGDVARRHRPIYITLRPLLGLQLLVTLSSSFPLFRCYIARPTLRLLPAYACLPRSCAAAVVVGWPTCPWASS
mmetsp:Transcript_1205/g.3037  ORF Transcript_1205/g.3037 Transcript_1205/m.3037 type:complete len:94 (+) Transcript_1205:1421-1702(+)